MKTKNLLLGFAALLCAVGSTFASLLVAPPHYINVRYAGQANFTCSTVSATCLPAGGNVCQVSVQGFTPTVFDNRINATTCSVPLTTAAAALPITKPQTIAEVR